jgi:hypothetical protein
VPLVTKHTTGGAPDYPGMACRVTNIKWSIPFIQQGTYAWLSFTFMLETNIRSKIEQTPLLVQFARPIWRSGLYAYYA